MKKIEILILIAIAATLPFASSHGKEKEAKFFWSDKKQAIDSSIWETIDNLSIYTLNFPREEGLVTYNYPGLIAPISMRRASQIGQIAATADTNSFHQIGDAILRELEERNINVELHRDAFDPRALPTLKKGLHYSHNDIQEYNLKGALEKDENDYALILDLDIVAIYEDLAARVKIGGKRTVTEIHGVLYNLESNERIVAFRTYLVRNVKIDWHSNIGYSSFESIFNDNLTISAKTIISKLFSEEAADRIEILPTKDHQRVKTINTIHSLRLKSEDFSGLIDCSDYYELTQNCGKRNRIQLRFEGHNLEFSANTDGSIIFISYYSHQGGNRISWHRSGPYRAVQRVYELLESSSFEITAIDSFNIIDQKPGFFIHSDPGAYDLIKALAEKAPNKGRKPPPPQGSHGKRRR